MTDNHIHIGHWFDKYYDASEIFEIVLEAGIADLAFSSTSSCIDNVLYRTIEKEITCALSGLGKLADKAKAFLWFVPDFVKQGITIEKAMQSLPYKGIKIHPRANPWNLSDFQILKIAHSIFDYASTHSLPVLIHTGYDDFEEANKFSQFFSEYPNVQFILAHGRPLSQTLNLLKRNNNVYCDTAFLPENDLKEIIKNAFGSKVILGSDFPITHHWRTTYTKTKKDLNITLREQYVTDLLTLSKFSKLRIFD